MNPSPAAVDRAWQAALAAQHQAIFGYDVLGPQLSSTDQPLAHRCQDAHRTVRNDVEAAMAAARLAPVQPQVDYPTLYPVPDPTAARRLAIRLEDACADAWRYLYLQAASAPAGSSRARALRPTAQEQLTASAIRATRWRALVTPERASVPFPGL